MEAMRLYLLAFLVLVLSYQAHSAPHFQEGKKFSRIINGTLSSDPIPYLVSVGSSGFGHFCGGTILSERFIITSAQCGVLAYFMSGIRIEVGGDSLLDDSFQSIGVKEFWFPTDENGDSLPFPNPMVSLSSMDNDLVILELEEAIVMSEDVSAIALPPDSNYAPADGTICKISGWGATMETPFLQPERALHYAMIPIVDDCGVADNDEGFGLLTDNMICAGGQDNKVFCYGDEGGPLVCQEPDGTEILAGIASFRKPGARCGNHPGVFTKVANYLDFIRDITITAMD